MCGVVSALLLHDHPADANGFLYTRTYIFYIWADTYNHMVVKLRPNTFLHTRKSALSTTYIILADVRGASTDHFMFSL